MNVNSLPAANWFQQLETKFMAGVQSAVAAAGNADQTPADSTGAAPTTPPAPATTAKIASTTPSTQFSQDTLSALISAQAGPPTSAQVAQGLISTLDGNGDGSLSLSEITNALGNPSANGAQSSGASSALSSAFAKMDTNGDGELSGSELAAALDTATKDAQSAQNGQGPGGVGGRHHHHHHHGGGASSQSTTQANPVATPATATDDEAEPAAAAA